MTSAATAKPSIVRGMVASVALLSVVSLIHGEDKKSYLSPPELFKRIEDSKVTYTIGLLEEMPDADGLKPEAVMWPPTIQAVFPPDVVESDDGSKQVVPFKNPEGCLEILGEGEGPFSEKKYGAAAEHYKKAARLYPKCALAHSHLGDCYLFSGEANKALRSYERSIGLNPHNFLGHFFKANALLQLEKREEALKSYATSLALWPHRESVLKRLEASSERLGITVWKERLIPGVVVRKREDGVGIYFEPEKPWWLVYGLCRALGLGEPGFREERYGESDYEWSLTEEQHCLLAMLENYAGLTEEGDRVKDPEIDQLIDILERGHLDGFIIYEIGSRIDGNVTLRVDRGLFDLTQSYVREMVLQSKDPPGEP